MPGFLCKFACCLFRFACVVVYVLLGGGIFVLTEPFDPKHSNEADRFFEYTNLAFMSITTIGDTHVYPKREASRIAYLVYSFLGIPLVIWALAIAGELQTRVYRKIMCEQPVADWIDDHTSCNNRCSRCRFIPFLMSSVVFISLGALSSFVTATFTEVTFVRACYFWWNNWTTVGYTDQELNEIKAFICWKWIGLVLLSGVLHSYLRWMTDMGKPCEFYCCKCHGPTDSDSTEEYVAKSTDLHFEPVLL